jgi:hypothetical protein
MMYNTFFFKNVYKKNVLWLGPFSLFLVLLLESNELECINFTPNAIAHFHYKGN